MKKAIIIALVLCIGVAWYFLDYQSDIQKQLQGYEKELKETEEKITQNNMAADNGQKKEKNTLVVFKTTKGDFSVELYMDSVPATAGNFLKLAKEDFYDGVKFHRVIPNFMIQGGDPNSKGNDTSRYGTGGPGYTIKDEFPPQNANVRGTISMANAGANTGGSQFFINVVDNNGLNDKHPVFGEVRDGMGVVDEISKVKTGANDIPIEPVVINDIEIKE